MKYFFLSDSWKTGRIWEFGGLWDEVGRRRKPHIQKRSLCIQEEGEVLWLYQAEDSILMVEVMPKLPACSQSSIGQVTLKRLLSAEQVVERLCEEDVFQPHWHEKLMASDRALSAASEERESNQEPAIALENKQNKQAPINAT